MYIKLKDADELFFSSCEGCRQSCCDGGRFVLAPLILDDFKDVYKNFLITFTWIDEQPRAVMLISNRESPCIYYKENRCSIYDSRPPACVMYPFTPYYDDVFIDSECEAVGTVGFPLKQKDENFLGQLHPSFYHHRLESFARKLEETEQFLESLQNDFKPLFEVEGMMLMAYHGAVNNTWIKMHHASLKYADHWS